MRAWLALPLVGLAACGGPKLSHNGEYITCDSGQTPIYSNRFVAAPGGSGVATGADALQGKTNSDGTSGGGGAGAIDSIGGSPSPSPTPSTPSTTSPDDLTAMTLSCGQTDCATGQVGVEAPPMVAPSGGPSTGAPTTGLGAAGTADTTATPTPAPPTIMPKGTILCTVPPPPCPTGQSPQFTSKQTWECTDCALVVTYGGIYGNYRRCVNEPHVVCAPGEVPTWVFEDEQWECKTKCDNGQYDQHTIQGTLVCVPC
jgi:hypothetical protein